MENGKYDTYFVRRIVVMIFFFTRVTVKAGETFGRKLYKQFLDGPCSSEIQGHVYPGS